MASANSWLKAQRKSDLVELADRVGMTEFDRLKKTELELALDDFIPRHAASLSARSDLAGYFASRSRALGSPLKRLDESDAAAAAANTTRALRVPKRRVVRTSAVVVAKPVQEEVEISPEPSSEVGSTSSSSRSSNSTGGGGGGGEDGLMTRQTPVRKLSLTSAGAVLPATPADVALAVDRSTTAVSRRMSSLYRESGIPLASRTARETLSTVNSILLCVSALELVCVGIEILSTRYAFTLPAMASLGTPDWPVHLPDMFLLLTSSFWIPAGTWLVTAIVLPCLAGYFFNLSAAASSGSGSGSGSKSFETVVVVVVDPLVFSVAKALIAYVVYGHGVTFHVLDPVAIRRLDGAVFGGYRGVLVGAAVTAIVSMYDAVLRR
ncbi:hypothetical protein XA68_17997 [Ophiocordyceps unilateralis]|uniref:Rho termination factor N-terminal domain-containing protein n=1 Tax=Ophiocordyceps unilateralis TaxID=268505 RepID=A0A2A9P3W0_OPHUN|nr:hypothetical protein XA68_17997 [Ophiocordyceps unilateralis]